MRLAGSLAIVLVMSFVAVGAAAPIVVPATPERLVEGHTVFTVIEIANQKVLNKTEYGAAVAILVREVTKRDTTSRFPGVLWFNDQYLVDPESSDSLGNDRIIRYPCSGAVLAVDQGAPDPRPSFSDVNPPVYVESYHITDPNDHAWDVDRWNYSLPAGGNETIWTVALMNMQAGYGTPDDGTSNCSPYQETDVDDLNSALDTGTNIGLPLRSPGSGYMNGKGEQATYNAVLFFYIGDLSVAGADKDHRPGSIDRTSDVSGCQSNTSLGDYQCPSGDDNMEGNSHPYNPFVGLPICHCVTQGGWHGGSDVNQTANIHATRLIDIYYGVAVSPPLPRLYRLIDTTGKTAAFTCDTGARCI